MSLNVADAFCSDIYKQIYIVLTLYLKMEGAKEKETFQYISEHKHYSYSTLLANPSTYL